MGLTSSLFAGLSGMKTNEFRMDVIGNNIANVNTYAFKSSRASFQSQFSNTFSFGTAPSDGSGGSNPMQVGTGVTVGGVQRDFSGGAPESTGVKTDLAIQGNGLFVVKNAAGAQYYTRDGSFMFNANNELITVDGLYVQGYTIDANYNITSTTDKITIPVGEATIAKDTSNIVFEGNLNADGASAIDTNSGEANGSVRTILDTFNSGLSLDDGTAGGITGATLLTDLEVLGTGAKLFTAGNIITMDEAVKGGQTLPTETLTLDGTETVDDLMAWMEDVLGIATIADFPNLPDFTADTNPIPNPGVTLNATGDGIQIVGNIGSDNEIELGRSAFKVAEGSGSTPPTSLPFNFTTADDFVQADIESVRTSVVAYDSLGIPLNIDITMVMESKDSSGGITWRYFAECADDTNLDRVVGTGTISFDGVGNFLIGNEVEISIDRTGSGANTPLTINLDFSRMDGVELNESVLTMLSQDGFESGTLNGFSIGADGVITGSFDNGRTRNLGQIAIATFRNYEGLVAQTDNLYTAGANSSQCVVKRPGELGAGTITPAALELSNVDLSREFINLIISSTGFSASSRVIQTSNQLLSELMTLTR